MIEGVYDGIKWRGGSRYLVCATIVNQRALTCLVHRFRTVPVRWMSWQWKEVVVEVIEVVFNFSL